MTLTKEWLQQTIAELEEERDAVPGAVNEDAANALAAMKLALVSLEAEAMTQVLSSRAGNDTSTIDKALPEGTMLYTAPPAPVSVPDVLKRLRSLVADQRALPRRKEWISGQQYSYVLLENVEAMVDEACRAAMLQGAELVSNRDELPDGWVACSERMPEKADEVLCAKEFDGPGDWRQKVGYYLSGKWTVYSASWTPTHWMPLPAAPQQEV
ncbi:DUF551 domain-containing protein [Enterobacter hormaechei]|uniref:DUF551 domain-containing protein n=1 Tax=Enterobacter hormaechei TaxID=158836 RepID=UPI002876709A|nr:DUF551 domain-containing protein [Enterobacter hormaechei]MDS0935078.1 DUF551 domain-containing protein [Enterobacter hormaechei]